MLAAGLTMEDIPCGKYGTLDKYVPDGDYVVIKFARWAFEKFKGAEDKLGTQMKAVGEVMSIGKTYKEAFQKAIRSLEFGRYGLGYAKNFNELSKDELIKLLANPTSERQFIMYEALRKGATVEELHELTQIKTYFIEQMKELVEEEEMIKTYKGKELPVDVLKHAKQNGFSDKYLSQILDEDEYAELKIYLNYAAKAYTLKNNQIMRNVKKIQNIPALLIHNRLDMDCPLYSVWQLHKNMPHSKLAIAPGIGHYNPQLKKFIAREIKAYLAEND